MLVCSAFGTRGMHGLGSDSSKKERFRLVGLLLYSKLYDTQRRICHGRCLMLRHLRLLMDSVREYRPGFCMNGIWATLCGCWE